jgi:hypothetical protein
MSADRIYYVNTFWYKNVCGDLKSYIDLAVLHTMYCHWLRYHHLSNTDMSITHFKLLLQEKGLAKFNNDNRIFGLKLMHVNK